MYRYWKYCQNMYVLASYDTINENSIIGSITNKITFGEIFNWNNMDNVVLSYVFDRKGVTKSNPKKEALIQIKIYEPVSRVRKYISTGEYILRSQYSPVGAGGLSIIKHPNAAVIKNRLDNMFVKVQTFVYSEKCQSMEDVSRWDEKAIQSTQNIVEFMKDDIFRRNGAHSPTNGQRSLISRLEEYGKLKTFSDLSLANIEGFDEHLRKTIKTQPTLHMRHSALKNFVERARKLGYVEKNPYDNFICRRGKHKDSVYLIESEVNQIIEYQATGKMQLVKDLFLFQCYTGLAFTDMQSFKETNIRVINGQKEIHGQRNKTGVPYVVLFLPKAEEIAQKYDYHFPSISLTGYNDYIKLMVDSIGIKKKVTSHSARHTFATYLINKGISIEAIPKILGHTNITQSLAYARMLGVTAVNEMRTKLL